MARRPKQEAIDAICRQWGKVRRQVLGIDDPQLSKDYIGSLRCTLGQRRDLHAGSTSEGKIDIHWPEVYTGEARLVNEAFHAMRPKLRVFMDLHYAGKAPAEVKADFMAISMDSYWRELRDVRSFVEGWLARSDAA